MPPPPSPPLPPMIPLLKVPIKRGSRPLPAPHPVPHRLNPRILLLRRIGIFLEEVERRSCAPSALFRKKKLAFHDHLHTLKREKKTKKKTHHSIPRNLNLRLLRRRLVVAPVRIHRLEHLLLVLRKLRVVLVGLLRAGTGILHVPVGAKVLLTDVVLDVGYVVEGALGVAPGGVELVTLVAAHDVVLVEAEAVVVLASLAGGGLLAVRVWGAVVLEFEVCVCVLAGLVDDFAVDWGAWFFLLGVVSMRFLGSKKSRRKFLVSSVAEATR